jgi:transposase, IS30 family
MLDPTWQSWTNTMAYTHLTREARYQIHALRRQGVSNARIAAEVGCHPSTVSREIRRNAGKRGYFPAVAHDNARARQTQRRNARSFSPEQWAHVACYLRQDLSPQQVAGRLGVEGALSISHEAIYRFVYQDKVSGGDLVQHLRCQKPHRKRYASGQQRRGKLCDRVCIEQREAIVNERSRLGDWEGDTVIGKHHQGALVTLVERKSRYTLAKQVDSRHSAGVTQAIVGMLRPHKAQCLTLTFDNGKEFAEHALIAKALQAKVYFAHPYHSWERGLNENTNGLLRQYFPKSTNLRRITQIEVDDAVYALNHRPRKCLGYLTPHEVFHGLEMSPLKLHSDALCM